MEIWIVEYDKHMLKVSQACVAYVSLAGFKSKHFIGSMVYKDYIKMAWNNILHIRDLLEMAVFKLTYHASLETRLFGCTVRNWQVVFQEGSKKAETDTKCYSQLNKILTKGCTGILIASSQTFIIQFIFQLQLHLAILYLIKCETKFPLLISAHCKIHFIM